MANEYDADEDWAEQFDEFVSQGYDEKRAATLASLSVAATLARRIKERAALTADN